MHFKSNIELKKGRLDIAPLIDVVFLLIIFFMLTSNFITQQGIKVNLPEAASGKVITGEDLVIFVTAEGKYLLNGKETGFNELSDRIESAARDDANILIRADRKAHLEGVIKVWDICRGAGIDNVNIATLEKRD
jgi:biopolymer transport protein ExbD